ncbi:MAG TPA: ribosome biogenesis GTP-binding protein YihA/YsxC [Nevskiaceae bacterium]|nr:ribosome biogenesis GTP-binding protein YihA/YsxC [Nevskiaceae bacterium]
MTPESTPPSPNPLRDARFMLSAARLPQLPDDDWPEVAFVGRSNAGKSSALNRLCQQRALARVSRTPGRTQLINLFTLPGDRRLVDLPGYGFAKAPPDTRRKWEALVGRYVAERRNLVGLILLMDIRHPLQPLDLQMLDWAAAHGRPVHILLTKADKLSRGNAGNVLQGLRGDLKTRADEPLATAQLFSAPASLGTEDARAIIHGWFTTPSPREAPQPSIR